MSNSIFIRRNTMVKKIILLGVASSLSACAHIDFGGDGLTYYDQKPYLLVTSSQDCTIKATVISMPAEKKTMKFISGLGSAELSASLSGGMLTSVGQKTDTKI